PIRGSFFQSERAFAKEALLSSAGALYTLRQLLPWNFCLSERLWSIEIPPSVFLVGRLFKSASLLCKKPAPGTSGAGICVFFEDSKPAEILLKHADGILFPGHCVPDVGAVHPEGATKPAGT